MTIFLATDLTEGEAHPMDDERIETRWFSHKEVRDLIDSGKIAGRQNDHRLLSLACSK